MHQLVANVLSSPLGSGAHSTTQPDLCTADQVGRKWRWYVSTCAEQRVTATKVSKPADTDTSFRKKCICLNY